MECDIMEIGHWRYSTEPIRVIWWAIIATKQMITNSRGETLQLYIKKLKIILQFYNRKDGGCLLYTTHATLAHTH